MTEQIAAGRGSGGDRSSGVPAVGLPLATLADGVVARVRADGAIECLDRRGAVDAIVHWWVGAEDSWRCATGSLALRPVAIDATPVFELALRVPGGDVKCRLAATRVGAGPAVVLRFRNESAVPVALAVEIERGASSWTAVAERVWRATAVGDGRSDVEPDSVGTLDGAGPAATSSNGGDSRSLPSARSAIGVIPLPHSPSAAPDGPAVADPAVRCVIGDSDSLAVGVDRLFVESLAPDAIARGWATQRRAGGDVVPPDDHLAGVVGLATCLARFGTDVGDGGFSARGSSGASSVWNAVVGAVAGDIDRAVASARSMSAREWRHAPPDAVIMLAWSLVCGGWDRSEWDVVLAHVGPAAGRICRRARSATLEAAASGLESVALAVALADLAGDPRAARRLAAAGTALPGTSPTRMAPSGMSLLKRSIGNGGPVRGRARAGESESAPQLATTDASMFERACAAVAGAPVDWRWVTECAERFGGGPVASLSEAASLCVLGRLASVRSRPSGIELWPSWPSEWNGRAAEIHNLGTPWGRVSAALRWHGSRPAVLWEVDEWSDGRVVAPPRLRLPALDPGAELVGWKGESFLAEPADVPPIPVTIGLGAPVRRAPRP